MIKRPESKQPIPESATKVFSGKIFDVYQWEQELFDGTKTIFEKLKRPDTVVVFPVLSDGRIVLTQQQQPGRESFIGATGGRIEDGEDVLSAAKRELLEESGYAAGRFILWDAQQPTSKIDWAVYSFIAKDLKRVSDPSLDAGEKITLKMVTFDEFLELGIYQRFAEKEIVYKLFEAKMDGKKMKELKLLFDPNA
ncbi:MAG: hypothetical protein A3B99_02635 [Candidatus Yanofskybacteria bacterium RIFCSPHIGHO2_02_FULL_44_12b]|uniref:Nudix hydrolase domain-containing protein n=2 Tax=Candidatus Yanofskyibacteriota TaxID=1752733 RepID=A0A1F8GNH5_9BACT|nr:MAG: NUDIX hydrolase [Candidatus Yanofskybacteria bacterium GW2011_GWA2_44_9]OGN04032.1 MAG: hypothetical protein A2659_00255 [Candidatus Yanofskybacteria bacterium RIFCSPHIGHO2_01_FULL_44_24]OGN15363.1 MAG: hypothetical protein A3B99_02635 [Candidatus Yanofskybacteria bacterium RIFCSPHIGHO2_02_FULL_44_12b]OGN25989.1 MAG: hypothetical protein A2925_04635 [Candidatus Yanofskybacteria bacterium RIFCSPLOWO2_01_FULL_44_22]